MFGTDLLKTLETPKKDLRTVTSRWVQELHRVTRFVANAELSRSYDVAEVVDGPPQEETILQLYRHTGTVQKQQNYRYVLEVLFQHLREYDYIVQVDAFLLSPTAISSCRL